MEIKLRRVDRERSLLELEFDAKGQVVRRIVRRGETALWQLSVDGQLVEGVEGADRPRAVGLGLLAGRVILGENIVDRPSHHAFLRPILVGREGWLLANQGLIRARKSTFEGLDACGIWSVVHVTDNDDLLTLELVHKSNELRSLLLSDVGKGRLCLHVGAQDHELSARGLVLKVKGHPVLRHILAIGLLEMLAVHLQQIVLVCVGEDRSAAREGVGLGAVVANPLRVVHEEGGVLVALRRAHDVPEATSILPLLVEFLIEQGLSVFPGEASLIALVKAVGELLG